MSDNKQVLLGVTLANPYVFRLDDYGDRPRWKANFLADPNDKNFAKQDAEAEAIIARLVKEDLKLKKAIEPRLTPYRPDDLAISGKTGDYWAGFEGKKWFTGSRSTKIGPIKLINKDQSPIFSKEELRDYKQLAAEVAAGNATQDQFDALVEKMDAKVEPLFYSGAKVNAVVRYWADSKSATPRVNMTIETVQFWEDGEPLAADNFSALPSAELEPAVVQADGGDSNFAE